MRKKLCLLLISGALIFVGYIVAILAIDTVRIAFMPGLVQVKEADFLKMMKSHQAVVKSISEVTGPGLDSYSVIWSYKNPQPPGNDIECATDWVKGSPDDLTALIKKYEDDVPRSPPRRLTFFRRMIRLFPFALFLLIACYLFRREVSSIFRPRA